MLRDSHFCGVKYGVFDIDQLQSELCTVKESQRVGRQLAISGDGVHALEQFVLAKYYLTNQVYRHKVRLITDQMLIRAVRLGIEVDQIEELAGIYAYDGSPEFAAKYTKWDDRLFLLRFGGEEFRGKYCFDLLRRLNERRLLKRVYKPKPLRELPADCRDALSRISDPRSKKGRDDLESALSVKISENVGQHVDSRLVVVHAYTIKSLRQEGAGDEGGILVDESPRPPKTFEERSALFRSISKGFSEGFVEVYAPVSYDTPCSRSELLKKLEGPITDVISTFLEAGGGKNGDA